MKTIYSLLVLSLFISCSDSDSDYSTSAESSAQNEADILAYIEANDLNAIRSDSGLYYVIKTEGTGDSPNVRSIVTVNYKGYFLNESVFDQSTKPATFQAGNLIPGFTEGLTYMKEGGEATFLIPARLGYGAAGSPPAVPGNTVILFDIELISIQ